MNTVGTHVRADLIDRLIELYCDWRTGCAEVQRAYERFRDASPADRAAAFAAYTAALDREESACESYAGQIHLIQTRFRTWNGPARAPEVSRARDCR